MQELDRDRLWQSVEGGREPQMEQSLRWALQLWGQMRSGVLCCAFAGVLVSEQRPCVLGWMENNSSTKEHCWINLP